MITNASPTVITTRKLDDISKDLALDTVKKDEDKNEEMTTVRTRKIIGRLTLPAPPNNALAT
jgi:hypothetical protein